MVKMIRKHFYQTMRIYNTEQGHVHVRLPEWGEVVAPIATIQGDNTKWCRRPLRVYQRCAAVACEFCLEVRALDRIPSVYMDSKMGGAGRVHAVDG